MLYTNRAIHGNRIQPLVDEDSAGASGQQVGRSHGAAIVTSLFADHGTTGIAQLLAAPSDDIRAYFAKLGESYSLPFLVALRSGLTDAAGDRLASFAVRLAVDLDPAELAREIAALRQGLEKGFDQGALALFRDDVPVTETFEVPAPTPEPKQAAQDDRGTL